ncbi:MAG TPA: hypothetical protein VI160_08835 [Gemmatimonadales bacterium]
MKTTLRAAALAAGLATWACGGSAHTGGPAPVRHDPDLVTAEELASLPGNRTLFEALTSLRPAWFRTNPSALLQDRETDVTVYMDRSKLGGSETLREITVRGVREVRHYSATEAEAQFGPGNLHGVIQVVTTRGN